MPYAEKIVGVYAIVNHVNGKCYVGSSTRIPQRWAEHRSRLRRGVHGNPHLQRAWSYYGEDAFEFTLLEEVYADELVDAEQDWLDYAREEGEVYNIGPVAWPTQLGVVTGPMPEWHRNKIRDAMLGWHELEYPAFRSVETGEVIPAGAGLADMCKECGLSYQNMWQVMRGKYRSHRGWVLDDSDWEEWEVGRSHGGKEYPAYYHPETGDYIPPGRNLARMCREQGLNPAHMRSIAQGTRYTHKGWRLCDA